MNEINRPLDLFFLLCYKISMRFILLIAILFYTMPAFAVETVELTGVTKNTVKISQPKKNIKGSLLIKDEELIKTLIETQNKQDLKDIEALWKGTVENNKVIEFALKKLATPESQRRIHSSLMAKTLSAIVSGSSFVPSFMGADPYIQTSAFAVGRLAQTLLNKKNVPQEVPLTDTELIELASLVEELQDKIINAYYNYKSSLSMLKDSRQRMLLYSKNYSKALDKGDILDISISSNLYETMKIQEYQAEMQAEKYHLELQRLAGKKVVDNLSLYKFNYDSALFQGKAVKK